MQVTNVWKLVDENKDNPRVRPYMVVSQEEDLLLVVNSHEPGYKIKFHHHCHQDAGTSQSYLVLKGQLTVRTRMDVHAPVQNRTLHAGDVVAIKPGEYYELENEGVEPVILYQAKRPAPLVQFLGRDPVDVKTHFADAI